MSQINKLYDVVIVGYGPVGATFANLLSRYGLTIAVLDQAPDLYDKPRAITIDHEVLRVFQACGLAEVMEKGIAEHPGTHYLGVDGQVIKIFDPLPPPYPLGWVPTATFVQPDGERALRAKLAEYGKADVLLSTKAVSFSQDSEGVTLTCQGPNGDLTLRARYLVACDGANSTFRKLLGIQLDDLAFDEWWMVVDALAGDLNKRPNKCFQYCWPSRPGTFLPGPGNLRRWEIKLLPGENPENFGRIENVLKVLGGFTDTSDLTIWRSAVYRFHALLAKSWRSSRIFLMGDAVHQMPPFLGQGLCAGIRDAVNLAWKLAFVLRGKADDPLLDTYEQERKPHVTAVAATAKEFGKIIGELDPIAARARDERLQAELEAGKVETIRQKFIPDLNCGVIALNAPLAGNLFPQPHIHTADGRLVRLDDLVPLEFLVVSDAPGILAGLSAMSLDTLQKLSAARVLVSDAAIDNPPAGVMALRESASLMKDWLTSGDVRCVVVRPDRYVFGGGKTAAEIGALIEELGRDVLPGVQETNRAKAAVG